MTHFFKVVDSGFPELDNKIIGITQNSPEGGYLNIKNTTGPSLWTVFDPKPIKEDSYDIFWERLAEADKREASFDIKDFNEKLKNNSFPKAYIIQEFEINDKKFIIFDFNIDFRLVMMVGSCRLPDRGNITGGKDGYFWIEDFYERRTHKNTYKKVFGLSDDEATEFMRKYKK